VSKRKGRVEPVMPPPTEAEEFMAILIWAQTSTCTCPAAAYFRRMGSRLTEKYIREAEPSG